MAIKEFDRTDALSTCKLLTAQTSLFLSLSICEKNETDPQWEVVYKNSTQTNNEEISSIINEIADTFLAEKMEKTLIRLHIFGVREGEDLLKVLFNGLSVILLKSGIRTNDVMCSACVDGLFVVYSLNRNSIAYMDWRGESFCVEKIYDAIGECNNVAEDIKKYVAANN